MPGNGSAGLGELVVLAWGDDAGDPSILQQCRLGLDSDLRAALPEGLARVSIMGWVSIMSASCVSLSPTCWDLLPVPPGTTIQPYISLRGVLAYHFHFPGGELLLVCSCVLEHTGGEYIGGEHRGGEHMGKHTGGEHTGEEYTGGENTGREHTGEASSSQHQVGKMWNQCRSSWSAPVCLSGCHSWNIPGISFPTSGGNGTGMEGNPRVRRLAEGSSVEGGRPEQVSRWSH